MKAVSGPPEAVTVNGVPKFVQGPPVTSARCIWHAPAEMVGLTDQVKEIDVVQVLRRSMALEVWVPAYRVTVPFAVMVCAVMFSEVSEKRTNARNAKNANFAFISEINQDEAALQIRIRCGIHSGNHQPLNDADEAGGD